MGAVGLDEAGAFDALQQKLVSMWPAIGGPTEEHKTMVVVPSVSMDFPPELGPVLPAYEERYLFLLFLLAQPRAVVIYLTGQPILPRIVDYFLALVPPPHAATARERLHLISIGDPSPRPLTTKILERPRTLERIRALIPDPERAHIVPFMTSDLEEQLAVRLGIPVYGADPRLLRHGTKTGSRRLFAEAGVAHPRGFEDLRSAEEVIGAARDLAAAMPPVTQAVLKLNEGVGGYGNALVDVAATAAGTITASLANAGVDGLPSTYLDALAQEGAVIEERIAGDDFRSPSAQLRIAPGGEVELLSTHDQILGGPSGQEYYGARFPADAGYAKALGDAGLRVGRLLARAGVLGRFAIDFVVTREKGAVWDVRAIEINLRKGGTTHPFLTLQLLTGGHYDAARAEFRSPTGTKHYVATDHLTDERLLRLTSDDLLDIAAADDLAWDEVRQSGVVFHMISALPVAGRVGFTAIGDSAEHAQELHDRATARLLDAASA